MRKRYDFSKGRRNPYAKLLKQQITIRLDKPTIEYFKELAGETGDTLPNPNQPVSEGLRVHRSEAVHALENQRLVFGPEFCSAEFPHSRALLSRCARRGS